MKTFENTHLTLKPTNFEISSSVGSEVRTSKIISRTYNQATMDTIRSQPIIDAQTTKTITQAMDSIGNKWSVQG